MKHLRANIFLADRGDRLGSFRSCPPPPPGGQVRTAPVAPPPATGAGDFLQDGEAASRLVHTQETAGASPAPETSFRAGGVGSAARETAPAENPKPPAQAGAVSLPRGDVSLSPKIAPVADTAGAVSLSDAVMVLAAAVAAYERCDLERAVEIALCAYAEQIGCGVLARAVADAGETHNREREHGRAGNPARPACGLLDDLHAVPDFIRVGENRFRGGGP